MPRPSSPVHAKASTNCPYLTLESPHHQRQHWIDVLGTTTRNSAEQCIAVCIGVVENRSAFVVMNASSSVTQQALQPVALPFRTNASRHRFEKTIHNVKYQKRRLNAVLPRVNHEDLVRFIIQDRNCLRARLRPSVAAKLRLVGALRSAGRSRSDAP